MVPRENGWDITALTQREENLGTEIWPFAFYKGSKEGNMKTKKIIKIRGQRIRQMESLKREKVSV